MHVGSKIIVPPFAARTSSSGALTMKIDASTAYNDANRVYESFPYMSVSGGDATSAAYKFAPIECNGYNSATITPFATTGGGNVTYAAYLIHSDNSDGGTPKLWYASLTRTLGLTTNPFPTTLTAGPVPDELYGGSVTSVYYSTKTGSETKASIDMYDNIFGTASGFIGSTSIPHQSTISFLGGATHLAITYTAATVPSGGRVGFIVTLTE